MSDLNTSVQVPPREPKRDDSLPRTSLEVHNTSTAMSAPNPTGPPPSIGPSVIPSTEQAPLPTPSSSGIPEQRLSIPPENLKPNACISCQRRKVKCDRVEPCSSCRRYCAHCEFRDPAPRKKRKLSEEDLHARLDRYESLLNSYGARVDERSGTAAATGPAFGAISTPSSAFAPLNAPRATLPQTDPVSRTRDFRTSPATGSPVNSNQPNGTGRLVVEKGSSRYLENDLWKGLSEQFKDPKEMFHASNRSQNGRAQIPDLDMYQLDEGGLVLDLALSHPASLRELHPQPPQIFLLWQAFLDNVNPITKLLHAPTVQRQILQACNNLDSVERGLETLMFAIYHISIVSLSQEECQATLGESKQKLRSKYQYATKVALMRSGFLRSSELVVLQAYVLYLLSMRHFHDVQTLWSLTGIATRMAQRIGLHHDGTRLGLPLFEIEMRRRLWWQIMPLDARTAELSGVNSSIFTRLWDTELPLNVNDSELNPDMKQLPVEHTGPTEMFLCLMRYNIGKTMRNSTLETYSGGGSPAGKLKVANISVTNKDEGIDQLEKLLEEKFLKHCDTSIPLHYLTALIAHSAVAKLRLMAHHPRQYPDKGASLPQSEKDLLFTSALRVVEADCIAQSEKSLQRFLWHVDAYFQWDTLIYLLSELRTRTSGDDVDTAWSLINKCFEHHPEIITNQHNPLHVAVCNLTRNVWDARIANARRGRKPAPERDQFPAIKALFADTGATATPTTATGTGTGATETEAGAGASAAPAAAAVDGERSSDTPGSSGYTQFTPGDTDSVGTPLPPAEVSPMDWALWDQLLQDWGLQAPMGQQDFLG